MTLIAFGFFLGALLAPLGALYNDISKGLTVIMGFWLFLTPVVYPPTDNRAFRFDCQSQSGDAFVGDYPRTGNRYTGIKLGWLFIERFVDLGWTVTGLDCVFELLCRLLLNG